MDQKQKLPPPIKWKKADLGWSAHRRGRCIGAAWEANGKFWCYVHKLAQTFGPFASESAAQKDLEARVSA